MPELDRARRTRVLRSLAAPATGLAIVGAITAYDISNGEGAIVIGTVVLGAFITALLGTPLQAALVAAVAAGAALGSGVWNDNVGDAPYLLRGLVVLVGGATAVIAARGRKRGAATAGAFTLLTALSRAVDEPLSPRDAIERIETLLVPAVADLCVIDVVRGDELRRMSVRAHGTRAHDVEQALLHRPPNPVASGVGVLSAVRAERPQLIQVDDELLTRMAQDERDLAELRALDVRSTAVLPLRARGEILGAVTLSVTGTSGRRYDDEDLEFLRVLAGRVALTIDNAGLTRDLRDIERQLGTALGGLSEAVTVSDTDGRTVYANAAALRLLGFASEEELLRTPPEDVMALFEITDEAGAPVSLERLPAWRLLAGERDIEPLLVRNVVRSTGEERWLLNTTSPVFDDGGELVRVVNVIENVTALKREERGQRFLAEASHVLASSLDYEATLQRVAEMAVPALADWCAVALPDERGVIRTVAVAHGDPDKVALARRLTDTYPEPQDAPQGVAAVVRSGETQVLAELSDELLTEAAEDAEHLALLRALELCAALIVPLVDARGATTGALSLVSAESGRRFSEADVRLAEELGRRAGTAVENARLYSERSATAQTLQRALLPDELPPIPGLTTAVLYRPVGELNEVGGDFYDLFRSPSGWMAVIGDVTGHGAPAARLTAMARARLRAIGELTGDPVTAVTHLNRALCDEQELTLMTVLALRISLSDARLRVESVCAGHPRPLLLSGGGASEVGVPGVILGFDPEGSWEVTGLDLAPGDTLLAYTDGITDNMDEAGETLGVRRLMTCLRHGRSAHELVEDVDACIAGHRGRPQRDDEALLVLQAAMGEPESLPAARATSTA